MAGARPVFECGRCQARKPNSVLSADALKRVAGSPSPSLSRVPASPAAPQVRPPRLREALGLGQAPAGDARMVAAEQDLGNGAPFPGARPGKLGYSSRPSRKLSSVSDRG